MPPTTWYAQLDDSWAAALQWNDVIGGGGNFGTPAAGDTCDLNAHAVLMLNALTIPALTIVNPGGGTLVADTGATVIVNAAIQISSSIITLADDTATVTFNGFAETASDGGTAFSCSAGQLNLLGGFERNHTMAFAGYSGTATGTVGGSVSGRLAADPMSPWFIGTGGGAVVTLGAISTQAGRYVAIYIGPGSTLDLSDCVWTNSGDVILLVSGTLTTNANTRVVETTRAACTAVAGGVLNVEHRFMRRAG